MSLTAIILAAGKSTRMKSKKPKVLHEVCGRPMLDYILQAAFGAGCDKVMVVVGHGKEEVIARFEHDKRIKFVEQTEQLGTGHAARMCEAELKKTHGDVFILVGDVPLIRTEVLRTLLQAHKDEKAAASTATAVLDDPFGYGRIIRDDKGDFVDIVEELDCTPEQRKIQEVFPSYYCVKSEELLFALSKLQNNNKKSEYYLTDIFGILRRAGKRVIAVQAVTLEDVLAPNTRQQLQEADELMQERIQRQLLESGVTIVNGEQTYVESNVSIGADTVIMPFSFVGRDSTIGNNCVIGPFASIPRGSILIEGTTVSGNVGGPGR
ncbi:MAG TPA: NTP transferase domain-containing protein [Tepidisphaeraceae bacterium]|jgi:bifunctional UDP-N-acetylglucosamine pyrophosphorylase/glucosamine-1-phosphate N-acetyltransferase|nr:NTP transferase domain-containing protein [Tepidisphaeraceae bacterium]